MPDPAPDAQYDEYGFPLNVYSNLVSAPTQAPAPVPAPTPAPAPAPAVQPAPVTPAPVAATLPPGPNPAQQQNAAMWNRISRQFGTLPLSQAETAVSAALRFNALRGYQDDIASGKTPAEALGKWAPLLYAGPKMGTIGQAGSLVRAERTPLVTGPRPMNIGGRAYLFNPQDQSMRPLTPPPRAGANQFELENYRSTLRDIQATQKELDANPDALDADDKRRKLQYLRSQAADIATRNRPATGGTSTGSTGRVRVRHPKTGRIGTIPASQLDQALTEGYSQVQ